MTRTVTVPTSRPEHTAGSARPASPPTGAHTSSPPTGDTSRNDASRQHAGQHVGPDAGWDDAHPFDLDLGPWAEPVATYPLDDLADSADGLLSTPAAQDEVEAATGADGPPADGSAPADGSWDDPDGEGRPVLRVKSDPHANRLLRAALGQGLIPDLYVTGGVPVKIERVSGVNAVDLDDDVPLPVRATPLRTALLANLFAHHTTVLQLTLKGGWAEWQPSAGVLGAVLAGSEWPELSPLVGIIGTPVLRRDWSLAQAAGYDRASGLFLAPTVQIKPVPQQPAPDLVEACREFVTATLLGDFEWEDTASRANYVGLMVTPYLRRPLKCLVPFAIISATMPGSGKSLLTALIGLLVGQQTVPWPADNDRELKTLITSTFTVESGAVIFDNIAEGEAIDSPVLANLLTNPVWSDRMLGGNTMGAFANDRLWMATGNNLRVGGDIASRSVYVRLAPKSPHPEQRSGFAIPDLELWLKDPANRAELLWRLLVLVADWVRAGTPRDNAAPTMRQFTPWARGVGGFLAHHGITGFLTNLNLVRGMDEEDRKWHVFLSAWRDRFGDRPVRCGEVMDSAALTRDLLTGQVNDPWEDAFITDKHGRRPRHASQLGIWLRGHVDRFHGDPPLKLTAADTDSHSKSPYYRVEEHQP